MAGEAQNVALLKEAYRLWDESRGGSVDYWLSIFADAFQFGSLAQTVRAAPYMTAYEDNNRLRDYFTGLERDWEMIEFSTEHFVAQGDRVVMLGRCSWRAKKTGTVVWTPKADSFRFADGKVIEFYEYFDTAQMRDAMTV